MTRGARSVLKGVRGYVCAHAYTVEVITRAAKAGVRTIEHGNLIDEPTAKADG